LYSWLINQNEWSCKIKKEIGVHLSIWNIKGNAHLNILQLAGVLWGHREKSLTSKTLVSGLGGEDWRGYYWSGELFNIGKTLNYDYFLDSSQL
jgi:hypothetical protein